jgi:5-methyltetrahydrofolate--homocysteine methyltransferase
MIGVGMNAAITNPLHPPVRTSILAADLLLGHDEYGTAWIADHRAKLATEAATA